jgi:osmotically-inducible protein OsmY
MPNPMPHEFDTNSSPFRSARPVMSRTVFDNGVEAELTPFADRPYVPPDDRELLATSIRALRDAANVPKGRVLVRVDDGVVVLEGRTSYYFERASAECAVRFLAGVRAVDNRIVVEPPALANDVRRCIADALLHTAVPDLPQISVQAVGGTVILQGLVHTRVERDATIRAAWTVAGVRSVIDNLTVSA